jgi:hypothetical protein
LTTHQLEKQQQQQQQINRSKNDSISSYLCPLFKLKPKSKYPYENMTLGLGWYINDDISLFLAHSSIF